MLHQQAILLMTDDKVLNQFLFLKWRIRLAADYSRFFFIKHNFIHERIQINRSLMSEISNNPVFIIIYSLFYSEYLEDIGNELGLITNIMTIRVQ